MVFGLFGSLLFNIANFLYLALVQGFVLGRLQRDPLLKISLIGCLFQVSRLVYYIHAMKQSLIAGVCGIIACASMDIAHTFVFFHRHGKYIRVGAGCFIAIAIYYIVGLNTNLKDLAEGKGAEAKGMAPTDFFNASTVWQLVAVIRFREALKKREIESNSSIMSPEKMIKVLLVIVVLEAISIVFLMSDIRVYALCFSGFQHSLSLSVMIYAGTMDFMKGDGTIWGAIKGECNTLRKDARHVGEVMTLIEDVHETVENLEEKVEGDVKHVYDALKGAEDKVLKDVKHVHEKIEENVHDVEEGKKSFIKHEKDKIKVAEKRLAGGVHAIEGKIGDVLHAEGKFIRSHLPF